MAFRSFFNLRLRNFLHSAAPSFAGALEDWRKTELYRHHITWHGFLMPLPPFIKRSIILRYACASVRVDVGASLGACSDNMYRLLFISAIRAAN